MAMKATFFVEYQGNKIESDTLLKAAKEKWVADGNLVKDIDKLELYFKPEESTCYYVVNDKKNGSFEV
jgi:hypothetical protein